MAHVVIMPRQGQSVESCVIGKWHKQAGDKVSVGDILFTYETDKATFDEEAKVEGTLLCTFFEEGDDVECLKNVCVIGEEGENCDEFRPADAEDVKTEQIVTEKVEENVTDTQQRILERDVASAVNISPRARMLISKTGADITGVAPSGANNRVMEQDVRKALELGASGTGVGGRIRTADTVIPEAVPNAPASADYEEVKLTNVRKIIAKQMQQSLSTMAQLTLNSSFDVTDIIEFRKKIKSAAEKLDLPNITITDIITYAVSRVILKHKVANAHFLDTKMLLFNNAHIGIAVDTPRGLLVPTLFNANNLSLAEVSKQSKVLFEQAKNGIIPPDKLTGGTFTITNLGTLGVESFTPVINPPQTCILGVCSIVERSKQGHFYPSMGLSLTFDHRALDGADAARFLKDLVDTLENFSIFCFM